MRFHTILLLMLAISPLSIFKRLRGIMELSYPLILIYMALVQDAYSEKLLGASGVSVSFDERSKIFILSTSVVFAMVALKKKKRDSRSSFLFLTSLLTLSALYMSNDLFNVYVLMEVLSVQAGLMALEGKSVKTLWATLKYLIVGGIGANVYLVGAAIYYSRYGTFEIGQNLPEIAKIFMAVGILMRVGAFGFGMWLPQFHSSVSSELSALFSGAFIGGGIFPAMRIFGGLDFAPYLALGGSLVSILSADYKRILAGSTMGHVGAMLSSLDPSLYFLSHSVSKAFLFLKAEEVKRGETSWTDVISIFLSFASISAFPMTLGGAAELGMNPIVKLSSVISSSAILSRISRLKPKGFKLDPISLVPFLILIRPSPFSLLPFLAIAGVFLRVERETRLKIEEIEWNVALSTLFLAGWLIWSAH